MTPPMDFEDWWGEKYRSLTKTLNSQGIAFTAWHKSRSEALEEAARVAEAWPDRGVSDRKQIAAGIRALK